MSSVTIQSPIYISQDGWEWIYFLVMCGWHIVARKDTSLLQEIEQFLSENFEMKDLGKSSFALGIETHHDRNHSMLDLSQESYIDCVLKRVTMPHDTLTHKKF